MRQNGGAMAYKVTMDAGHGGWDNGAMYQGRREKNDTLKLALAVGQILEDNGVDVNYTRTVDVYQRPSQKAQIANDADSDLFISIHRNAAATPGMYNGVQTLIYDNEGIKEDLANNINQELEEVGFNNIGTEIRKNLTVLKNTDMPAALIEAGFIDSETDNQIFDERFYQTASAIARGIIKTLMAQEDD